MKKLMILGFAVVTVVLLSNEFAFAAKPIVDCTCNGGDCNSDGFTLDGNFLNGTPGNDFIDCTNSTRNLWIEGNGGVDTIIGGSGNDFIRDGDGPEPGDDNDLLQGRDGKDWIEGGWGVDTILGGDGNDFLRGGKGIDIIDGGGGKDTCEDTAENTVTQCEKII